MSDTQIIRLATVTETGLDNTVLLRFDGENAAREKAYKCLSTPSVNDRVCVVSISGSWVVLGSIGSGSGGGSQSGSLAGVVFAYGGSSAPSGYLLCDGSAVSRAAYSALFSVIGTAYGSGDGSTTFNVPNLKGRAPVGYDSSDSSFDTLGETGGEKSHTLTSNEMPAHAHTINSHTHGNTFQINGAGGHYHQLWWPNNGRAVSLSTSNGGGSAVSGYHTGYTSATVYDDSFVTRSQADHSHGLSGSVSNTTATMQNAGGGGGHNNMPPYIVLNYIIKT